MIIMISTAFEREKISAKTKVRTGSTDARHRSTNHQPLMRYGKSKNMPCVVVVVVVVVIVRPGERVGHPELFPGAHSQGWPMGAHGGVC